MRRYFISRTGELPAFPWTFESYDGEDRGTTKTHAEAIAAVYSKEYWNA